MCSLRRTLKPSASSDSRAIARSTLLHVALAGLTSATVSPGASRFGLIGEGAAAPAQAFDTGSCETSAAVPREGTKRRRLIAESYPAEVASFRYISDACR